MKFIPLKKYETFVGAETHIKFSDKQMNIFKRLNMSHNFNKRAFDAYRNIIRTMQIRAYYRIALKEFCFEIRPRGSFNIDFGFVSYSEDKTQSNYIKQSPKDYQLIFLRTIGV